MFYTILFLIVWLVGGAASFSFSSPVFWGLIVALIADALVHGYPYLRR